SLGIIAEIEASGFGQRKDVMKDWIEIRKRDSRSSRDDHEVGDKPAVFLLHDSLCRFARRAPGRILDVHDYMRTLKRNRIFRRFSPQLDRSTSLINPNGSGDIAFSEFALN